MTPLLPEHRQQLAEIAQGLCEHVATAEEYLGYGGLEMPPTLRNGTIGLADWLRLQAAGALDPPRPNSGRLDI